MDGCRKKLAVEQPATTEKAEDSAMVRGYVLNYMLSLLWKTYESLGELNAGCVRRFSALISAGFIFNKLRGEDALCTSWLG